MQAAIVRVMKTRRECSLPNLLHETTLILQNQFVPSILFIKQNIAILIEKEYMKELSSVENIYIYVA